MNWQRYLTDAERKFRPASMQALYSFPLDFTIKGIAFRRWFRSAAERDKYHRELPASNLARLIDAEREL